MAAVHIYVEGGRRGPEGKRALQAGFRALLREFDLHRATPKVTACGDGGRTRKAFLQAYKAHPQTFVILLVDAEGPVTLPPRAHLSRRHGGSLDLEGVDDDQVHLMVQAMEAWLIADRQAIRKHYKADFREKALPAARCPSDIPKGDLKPALRAAGGKTGYDELADGPALLKLLDPAVVRAKCPDCKRLFDVLCREVGIEPFANQ
jgi:hypothetical protein